MKKLIQKVGLLLLDQRIRDKKYLRNNRPHGPVVFGRCENSREIGFFMSFQCGWEVWGAKSFSGFIFLYSKYISR